MAPAPARVRAGPLACALALIPSLFACTASRPSPSPIPTPVAALTSAPAITQDPTPTRAPDPAPPTPTPLPACLEEPGSIVVAELVDPALPRSLPYRIYLPPCFGQSDLRGYPVLYLLHGLDRTDSQWDDLGADEVADRLIGAGDAPPFLMVMPWERKGLDFESALLDFLLPAIEREYRASPDRSDRGLAGISRGAGWALRIGTDHPGAFGAVGLHSPAVLAPDLYNLPGLFAGLPPDSLPSLWIDIGDRDPLRASARQLTSLLDEHGVRYAWRQYPGWHTEDYWAAHLEVYLRWHVAQWQDVPIGR